MTVYIVTSTGFEDPENRCVDAAFSTQELADQYIARIWNGRERLFNVRVDILELDKA